MPKKYYSRWTRPIRLGANESQKKRLRDACSRALKADPGNYRALVILWNNQDESLQEQMRNLYKSP